MKSREPAPRSYLMRIWFEPASAEAPPQCRVSIRSISSGKRHGFGSLDQAICFLRQQVAEQQALSACQEK